MILLVLIFIVTVYIYMTSWLLAPDPLRHIMIF